MKRRVFIPIRRHVFIGAAFIALAGCTRYDPSAAQPQGGRLPLDQGGDRNIAVVSGTQDPNARAMRPTADEVNTSTVRRQ